ncbi:hypothetical protein BROUX41_002076 [Berkeleyomyces rouxiae]|uniref:uncharacterized protein n=1 Tax=Berkeleyomyces rouxiae TaxID=2035830 RepID=UPI003B7CC9DD
MATKTFYDFKPLDKKGKEYNFEQFKGKVVLIINTASKCGFTPQYAGLEKLYKALRAEHGDDVQFLGFPCNQFGSQEPGNDDEIQSFCQINYGVTFPILGKIDVNGDNTAPFYSWLKDQKAGLLGMRRIKWNFEKFLIGRDGQVINRWASTTKPEALRDPIVEALQAKTEGSSTKPQAKPDAETKADTTTTTTAADIESKLQTALKLDDSEPKPKPDSSVPATTSKPDSEPVSEVKLVAQT